jgi:type I restriction enzyme S subunit
MSEWKEYKLKDLGQLQRGRSRHRPRFAFHLYGGKYPFIQTGQIREASKYITKHEQTYSEEGLKQSKLWPKGTLCITIAANIAELAILNFDACFPDSVLGFIPDKKITDLDFIYYTLTHFQRELKHIGEGSVQDNINLGTFEDLLFPIPSLPEQTAIASILSSLDNKIDLLHRQNATLEKMAETLFRQWFVEDAKEEWVTDTLGKLFDIGIGRTPPRKEHHWFSENPLDIKWVSIKDMGNSGVYISSVSEYLTKEAVDRFSIPIIPENTVMLSFKMTIGRLAITTEKMLSNEAIAHFKVKKNSKLFSEFLYLYLKTYQWEQLGSTSSIVEAINSQMIKEMEIIIPEENLLIGFKKIVEPYFQKIKSNQTQIRTLTALRDTLLPKLMSGELRVEMS